MSITSQRSRNHKENCKRYYRKHKDAIRIRARARYLRKRDVINKTYKERWKTDSAWRQKKLDQNKRYREQNKERRAKVGSDYRVFIKRTVIDRYGGRCACCGEHRIGFLCIDHIGHVNGGSIYRWLHKQKYPSGFRVLCHNCNMALSICKGVCPHVSEP